MAMVQIRGFQPADRPALYRICLQTADAGRDASELFARPELPGDVFVGPYLQHAPGLALVAVDEDGVCGYVLGTADSQAFRHWQLDAWQPGLRQRHAPDSACASEREVQWLQRFVHGDPPALPEWVADHPAHLHIDLLPRAQGKGIADRLMAEFEALLQRAGAPGVHLGVNIANHRAIAFYLRCGFRLLREEYWGLWLGKRLP